ncbi:MAG: translation initiation factor IF-2 [Sedimentisphaerales bacterium]|nr:translation initiation factor IF-2 [Sedimentisphaerales bacterium]
MASTRVYILARELGVKSSAVVEKCHAEGLDVKNHMSMISAGLAATIREWFTEGANITTVETTKKVDLKRVRVKKKRKQATKKKATEQQIETISETAGAAEGGKVEQQLTIEKPRQTAAKPPKQQPIVPAGPMLEKPTPAQLKGPKIVRVESPESLPARKQKPKQSKTLTEQLTFETKLQKQPRPLPVSESAKGPPRHISQKKRRGEALITESEAQKKAKQRGRWRERDIEERKARLEAAGGQALRLRPVRKIVSKTKKQAAAAAIRPSKASVTEPVTVRGLSAALAVKSSDIIAKLIEQNVLASANQTINSDLAELIALEFGTELTVERKSLLEEQIQAEFEARTRKNLKKRSVVATMLGHVDHGKTSLLDKIRSAHVTDSEAGGITQHIGAYQVSYKDEKVTFLDTPGHEAFTAMRGRGANMTDVVVLVVAADDGVMPQTVEAIHHAEAAEVPIIVALNKIDLPGCDYNRIYSQLAEHGLSPVEWGGTIEVVKTSAVTGEGIDDLLEHLDYVAELTELQADDTVPATGWVVEARMSPTQGAVATLLIKEGRLAKGDVVLAGQSFGRVKTLKDCFVKTIKAATSSMAVEITGLSNVPQAGDRFYCLDDINRAKEAAGEHKIRTRQESLTKRTQVTLDNLFEQIEAGKVKELNLIIRADVQGSVDVLIKYLSELSTDEVKIKILHASTGGITEGDVVLAEASNAIIIGFNVTGDETISKMAEAKGVDIRLYTVIYRITEELRKSMEGLLEPEYKENSIGRAAVRETFKISKVGTIAGCYVSDGIVRKNAKMRLIRDNIVIRDELAVESLKHFKDDAREVRAGLECGIKIANFDDIKVDDVLEFYEIIKVARSL